MLSIHPIRQCVLVCIPGRKVYYFSFESTLPPTVLEDTGNERDEDRDERNESQVFFRFSRLTLRICL